jgi:hypothetical protein
MPRIKLTDSDRLEILKLLSEGHSVDSLAERWDVSTKTIRRLRDGANVPYVPVRQLTSVLSVPIDTNGHNSITSPAQDEGEGVEDYLWRLRRRLVVETLSIMEDRDKRTSDRLKAIDMLAKWSGLHMENEQRTAKMVEERVQGELGLFFEAVNESESLSEHAKDQIYAIAEAIGERLQPQSALEAS